MSKEKKDSDTLIKNTEETERKKLCDKVLSMGPPTVSEIEEIWRRISAPPSWRDISSIYPDKKRDLINSKTDTIFIKKIIRK